jgi:hypothetical protein
VLKKILRNLEEYHAIRARDPRAAYDDVSMAKAIWDEGGNTEDAEKSDSGGEAASAAGDRREDSSGADATAVKEGESPR